MIKREFLQLSSKLGTNGSIPNGKMMSTKLDGVRCFWDGGITRGLPVSQIPWANTAKDARLLIEPISTGLWSRYGKTLQAHPNWIDRLPPTPLDGELWIANGMFQKTVSFTSRLEPREVDWEQVKYMVWDSPNLERWLIPGRIKNSTWEKVITPDMHEWTMERASKNPDFFQPEFGDYYEFVYHRLKEAKWNNEVVKVIEQTFLSRQTSKAMEELEAKLNEVISAGGEGLMLHHHSSRYFPKRHTDLLKFKPYDDDEGVVVGYTWGELTTKGSKLLGLMGAIIVKFGGKQFKLSGFTDDERVMDLIEKTGEGDSRLAAKRYGSKHPGEVVEEGFHNPKFPLGSEITFRHRGFTDDGIPREARFFRAVPNGLPE